MSSHASARGKGAHATSPLPGPSAYKAAILAGGKSSRFGSNKALALLRGRPIIEIIADTLSRIFPEVSIISNDPASYVFLSLPVLPDIHPGLGPLSGIHSALIHLSCPRLFVVACDMPLLDPRLIEYMFERGAEEAVILPEGPLGPEPLHAIYPAGALPVIDKALRQGRLKLKDLLPKLPTHVIGKEEVEAISPGLRCLKNVNTLEGLHRIS